MGQSVATDICTDCGPVPSTDLLLGCGRTLDDEWVVIQLCIDCPLAAQSPEHAAHPDRGERLMSTPTKRGPR